MKLGPLDRLPRPLRHLLIMLAASLLSWAGTDLVPLLQGREGAAALAGPLLAQLILWASPLVRSYGSTWERNVEVDGRHEASR